MLGQLLDRHAAVEQDAFVAVDIGDLGFAAAGRGEARVVGEHAGLGVELADVDHIRPDRAAVDRERPVLVADGKLGGLDVGAGLRVHDCTLEPVGPATGRRIAHAGARAETA